MHWLVTTPGNSTVSEMLDEAFKADEETRLFRIGIATHSFVDSWARQNFVGWYDYFNNIELDPKPDMGHADAEHYPDWISHSWQDSLLVDKDVNNMHRFLSEAKALYQRYCDDLKPQVRRSVSSCKSLEKKLVDIMGTFFSGSFKKYEKMRVEEYKKLLDWDDFDERHWFEKAIDTKVHGFKDPHKGSASKLTLFKDEYTWKKNTDWKKTEWYNFQRAVKAHEWLGIKLLSSTFAKIGYVLKQV